MKTIVFLQTVLTAWGLFAATAVAAEATESKGDPLLFLFFYGLFGGLVLVILSTKFIRQGHAGVIERMGKYVKTVNPGVHFLMPIFSKMIRVNLKEQSDHYEPQNAITRDNMQVRVDAVMFFRIIDPRKSIYDVDNFKTQVETLTIATLRNVIGSMTLSECLQSREMINAKLREVLDEHTGRMGVKVTSLEINAIDPPRDFREAMELEKRAEIERNAVIKQSEGQREAAINRAEGEKRAAIALAEGEREALVARAEGERDASRLRAEGRAQAYSELFKSIKDSDINAQVLSIRYLEALEKVANGKATTLILPTESSGILSAVAQIAQTLQTMTPGGDGEDTTIADKLVTESPENLELKTIRHEEPEDPGIPLA